MTTAQLIGIGSPLVDEILAVPAAFIDQEAGGGAGGMTMVEPDEQLRLIAASGATPVRAPGGAAANTTAGIACLGVPTAFIGCIGRDELGDFYRESLRRRGCDPRLPVIDEAPTGRVLSLVTPDAQRTMRTCLGAAARLSAEHLPTTAFTGARAVMLEGYALFNPPVVAAAVAGAKAAGAALALDLASFEVVQACRSQLDSLLAGAVDIVFANEDEARAWSGGPDIRTALDDLARRARIAVVKVGKDGAWIASGSERHQVPAAPIERLVDTTGAGDTWAAGFLAGWLRGLPLPACGQLGGMAAAAVVQVEGAVVPAEAWRPLKGWLDAWS
jgi:sugar/nucleoside kinase (ribokinase family)